jgi:hypothetical protein
MTEIYLEISLFLIIGFTSGFLAALSMWTP